MDALLTSIVVISHTCLGVSLLAPTSDEVSRVYQGQQAPVAAGHPGFHHHKSSAPVRDGGFGLYETLFDVADYLAGQTDGHRKAGQVEVATLNGGNSQICGGRRYAGPANHPA